MPLEIKVLANPLGVDDYETKVFKAFPNPVADMLTIQGNLPIEQVEVFLDKVSCFTKQPD